MKAEAPEKIYLKPLLMEDGESVVRRCTFERQRDSQIEYIRTDAFIEKACEYLENAAIKYAQDKYMPVQTSQSFKAGAQWQKENLWKPADGDDLPDIDRKVIALLDNGKVVFAHRPPEYWDGKDIVTGKVTRNYPKTYDKGGWNIPNVKYWLDVDLPKQED